MVTPFMAVFLKQGMGMSIRLTGFLMALSTFVQFGGGIFGGLLAHRVGFKQSMVTALSLRTLGFVLLSLATQVLPLIFPAILLVAIGPALYLPANRAYTVRGAPPDLMPTLLSINNSALNAGMALGPLVATRFVVESPRILFAAVGLLFAILTGLHHWGLHEGTGEVLTSSFNPTELRTAVRRAWRPLLVNTAIFYIYFHFQTFMGLYLSETNRISMFGWIMLINLTVLFIIQPLLAHWIGSVRYTFLLIVGFIAMGSGMSFFGIDSRIALLIGTLVMSVGQAILFLRGDVEIVSSLPNQPALAFGLQRLSTGIGGLCSGIAGGIAFDHFKVQGNPGMFWVSIFMQCLAAAALYLAKKSAPSMGWNSHA